MTTATQTGGSYARAFESLSISPQRYLLRYALPMLAGGIAAALLLQVFVVRMVPVLMRPLVPAAAVGLGAAFAFLYPVVVADRRKTEINTALPFFMTHLGVLATSNLAKPEIFRLLSEKKEYGALAEELRRVHHLAVQWNMPLPQACRLVAVSTPSQILGDFLDRLAQAFETGQDLEMFLRNEQHVVMKEYAAVYETSIYQVEQLKDMYTSLIMSAVFFSIFAIITPIITNVNPTQMLVGVVVLFAFIEFLLLFLLKMRVPNDKIWTDLPLRTKERDGLYLLLAAGAVVGTAVFLVLLWWGRLPLAINLAAGATPLAAAGFHATSIEKRIRRREDNYGAFIRSVGSAAESRGGSLREVLKKVRTHNFGPLTSMVQNLFARLTWRLQDLLAWRHFAAESGSKIVENFSEMFVEAIRAGGKPDAVGSIINDNVVRMLSLRRARYSTASTLRGLLVGLTASMAFTLFIGLGILKTLGGLFAGRSECKSTLGTAARFDPCANNPVHVVLAADTDLIAVLLTLVLVLHAVIAGVMVKLADGGHPVGGLVTMVALLWIGAVLSVASSEVIQGVFRGIHR